MFIFALILHSYNLNNQTFVQDKNIKLGRANTFGSVIPGSEYYEHFLIDNVLSFTDGTTSLHYHIYIPEEYEGDTKYALYITLPGYGAYYFQGVAVNLKYEEFAIEAKKYNGQMIIVAPQPNDWGETSKKQIIGLTEYIIANYNIDAELVFISGYSGGGETLSLVVSERPELYTAAIHISSKWDGDLSYVSSAQIPIYFVIGENDEYYSSKPAQEAYTSLVSLYKQAGLDQQKIDQLVILDIRSSDYFESKNVTQHEGGCLFAKEEEIMSWLFDKKAEKSLRPNMPSKNYTLQSTVDEVTSDPAFGTFGHLLFPVNRYVSGTMTLQDVSSSSVYTWYNYIDPDKTVEIIQHLHNRAESGKPVFYDIYTEQEKQSDNSLRNTGLFFFGGNRGAPFAIVNAGGAFSYVGAMHDSFPHALELSKMGHNAFALIYRPGESNAYNDLARAINFLYHNAGEIGINPTGYSLWGGSAGARMAAELGNGNSMRKYGYTDVPRAAAVIMQYTGYTRYDSNDPPTYACVGTSDGIANYRTMENRLNNLKSLGIPTEFHSYQGLPHGFGLGKGTIAWGWINDAAAFWMAQLK